MIVLDTVPSGALLLAVGVLFASGVYLLLERSLTRVLLGFVLMGNGANLAILVAGGRAGAPPITGSAPESEPMSDPLAQAMVLTSIVIMLSLVAFVLAMAYRSWQLHGHDEVQDDLEDRRIARLADADAPSYSDSDALESGSTLDEEADAVRDEVALPDPVTDDVPGSLPGTSSDGHSGGRTRTDRPRTDRSRTDEGGDS